MVARSQHRWQTPIWKRELAQAFTRPADLLAHLGLDPALGAGTESTVQQFPLLVPRGFAALMESGNPDDPLLRQVLPTAAESAWTPGFDTDPVGDAAAVIAPGLLQKYTGRVLLLATGACATHCRYCFRRHFPHDREATQVQRWHAAVAMLTERRDIDEVILSGGDPLMLDDQALDSLIERLERIPHLRRLRLHTRLPVVLPSRVTAALCDRLANSSLKTVVVLHVNHPRELGDAAATALAALRDRRLPLFNQAVLLHRVNDDADILTALVERLFDLGVQSYYLHMLDPVAGAAHFAVPEIEARALMEHLRERLPGYLLPRLVREVPGGASKRPLV